VAKTKATAAEVREALLGVVQAKGWGRAEARDLLRPPRGQGVGAAFERKFAKELSTWWCGADDAVWRAQGSGGRATVRARKGAATAGGYGDLVATDNRAAPLFQWATWELKSGYTGATIGTPAMRQFFAQAIAAQTLAGAYTWAVVHHTPRQGTWVWMPVREARMVMADPPKPSMVWGLGEPLYRPDDPGNDTTATHSVLGCPWVVWSGAVCRATVRELCGILPEPKGAVVCPNCDELRACGGVCGCGCEGAEE
jgi:hypothetical protein